MWDKCSEKVGGSGSLKDSFSRDFELTGRRFVSRWAFHRKTGQQLQREKESRLEPSSTTVEVFTITLKAFI
jgi:hypothetical protein